MNDTELDELLNRWKVPAASTELRGKVWRAFRPPRRPRFLGFDLKPMFAGTALGVGLCLFLLITQAFPQTLRVASPLFRIPYTVDSEFVDYDNHGVPTVDMYATSYTENGREILLSSALPGRPFVNVVRRVIDVTNFLWYKVAERSGTRYDPGCLNGAPAAGRATLLGYSTVARESRTSETGRITVSMAPDLGCFVMKFVSEEKQPDGAWRIVKERHALSVTRTGE